MVELKREYVIPLRAKSLKAPKWRRSKKSMGVLKDFVFKHMKCDNIIICAELNHFLWSRGAKNPPGKVSVICLKKEILGKEKVLVNLSSVGIDSQLKMYVGESVLKEEVKKDDSSDKVIDVKPTKEKEAEKIQDKKDKAGEDKK